MGEHTRGHVPEPAMSKDKGLFDRFVTLLEKFVDYLRDTEGRQPRWARVIAFLFILGMLGYGFVKLTNSLFNGKVEISIATKDPPATTVSNADGTDVDPATERANLKKVAQATRNYDILYHNRKYGPNVDGYINLTLGWGAYISDTIGGHIHVHFVSHTDPDKDGEGDIAIPSLTELFSDSPELSVNVTQAKNDFENQPRVADATRTSNCGALGFVCAAFAGVPVHRLLEKQSARLFVTQIGSCMKSEVAEVTLTGSFNQRDVPIYRDTIDRASPENDVTVLTDAVTGLGTSYFLPLAAPTVNGLKIRVNKDGFLGFGDCNETFVFKGPVNYGATTALTGSSGGTLSVRVMHVADVIFFNRNDSATQLSTMKDRLRGAGFVTYEFNQFQTEHGTINLIYTGRYTRLIDLQAAVRSFMAAGLDLKYVGVDRDFAHGKSSDIQVAGSRDLYGCWPAMSEAMTGAILLAQIMQTVRQILHGLPNLDCRGKPTRKPH